MHPQIPWWTWTVPLWPTVLTMLFVLLTGWLRGHATGDYPSVQEWSQALLGLLQPTRGAPSREHKDRPTGLPQQADPDTSATSVEEPPIAPCSSRVELDDKAA
jgi:hypothetical protein